MSTLRSEIKEPLSTAPVGELLPPFSAKQNTHLPTPQSPNDIGRYLNESALDSPVVHGAGSAVPPGHRDVNRKLDFDGKSTNGPTEAAPTQCFTPESSPYAPYPPNHSQLNPTATPRYIIPPSNPYSTPKQIPVKHEANTSRSPSSEPLKKSSTLSSPFMEKLSIQVKPQSLPADPQTAQRQDASSQQSHAKSLSPPFPAGPSSQPTTSVGSEMERIRQTMLEDRRLQFREAEKRRPEYLKRAKRSALDLEPDEDEETNRAQGVGIMESPQKGRRLALFQETSEESFEESLMAGGYGRYRTADWVRQPQPIALPSPTNPSAPTVVSLLEEANESPPTEKEIKKRKRLAAFTSEVASSNAKLCTVELEGKGRVLVDIPTEDNTGAASPEPSPNKKRLTARKKKKGIDPVTGKRTLTSKDADDQGDKPNWPDAEFPWKLRTEERVEHVKAEQDERMRWIERFLDRDSDDEDDTASRPSRDVTPGPIPPLPEYPVYTAMGRGKMVPVRVYSQDAPATSRFSDPGDARAALLSKKSVRTLSYRQQRRQRSMSNEGDDETVCICNGKDDGRELVQCDACQTWYHLQCIGIKNIAELGREEDPWFCRRCARSPSPTSVNPLPYSEPTFVPTEERPHVRRPLDTSFFPYALQDSPNWVSTRMPRTPTRTSDAGLSWTDSHAGPLTPQHSAHSARIYSSPFDSYGRNYEDTPFDPTSTPSRGIKFHAPFTTPKNTAWSSRSNAPLFHTPVKPLNGSAHSASSLASSYASSTETPSGQHYDRTFAYDESPIRRNTDELPHLSHNVHTPSRSRVAATYPTYLDESPIVRSLGSQVRTERGQHKTVDSGVVRHDYV